MSILESLFSFRAIHSNWRVAVMKRSSLPIRLFRIQPRPEHIIRWAARCLRTTCVTVWRLGGRKRRTSMFSFCLQLSKKIYFFYKLWKLKIDTNYCWEIKSLTKNCSLLVNFYITTSYEYTWDFHINGFLLSPDLDLFIPQPRDESFLHLSLIGFPI